MNDRTNVSNEDLEILLESRLQNEDWEIRCLRKQIKVQWNLGYMSFSLTAHSAMCVFLGRIRPTIGHSSSLLLLCLEP